MYGHKGILLTCGYCLCCLNTSFDIKMTILVFMLTVCLSNGVPPSLVFVYLKMVFCFTFDTTEKDHLKDNVL